MTAIDGEKKTKLRTNEKQVRVDLIFCNCPDRSIGRQIAGDLGPRSSGVRAFQKVGFEIRILMILQGGVDGIRIMI